MCETIQVDAGAPFEMPGAESELIRGNVHLPRGDEWADAGDLPLVLVLHGFKGYKDYGFFPHLTAAIADIGLVAVRFNFSHSGIDDDPATFGRPDLFERDSWSRQLADVQAVLAAAESGNLPHADRTDAGKIGLVGHSRGGVVALLTGGSDERIDATVALASPSSSDNLDDASKQEIREQGFIVSPSSRTGQDLHVGRAWLEDIEANREKLDVLAAVGRMTCPLLVIHGTSDASVPAESADRIADAYPGTAEKLILGGVNHVFNCRNPFTGASPALNQLLVVLEAFLREHLQGD